MPPHKFRCLGITSQIAKFMGPTWGPPGSCRPQVGPMLAPWTLLSGMVHVPDMLSPAQSTLLCLYHVSCAHYWWISWTLKWSQSNRYGSFVPKSHSIYNSQYNICLGFVPKSCLVIKYYPGSLAENISWNFMNDMQSIVAWCFNNRLTLS